MSTIWHEACDRADGLMDRGLWSQAREVLEEVDRLHPGADCVLDRFAEVYEELGETDCLTAVNSRRTPNSIPDELIRQLIDSESRFRDDERRHVNPASREVVLLDFEIVYDPIDVIHRPKIQAWAEDGVEALGQNKGQEAEVLFKSALKRGEKLPT